MRKSCEWQSLNTIITSFLKIQLEYSILSTNRENIADLCLWIRTPVLQECRYVEEQSVLCEQRISHMFFSVG